MDDTRTATLSLHQSLHGPKIALEVAWHPDPSFVGGVRTVAPGERLELGRTSAELGGALQDGRISRRHVQVARLGTALSLQDLGSHNGTWLNGERITHAPAQPGDVLAIGQVLLVVRAFPQDHRPAPPSRLIGQSAAMVSAMQAVERVAGLETPVLVQGESGTGKELIARELHDRSARHGSFVPVNCAGVADTLLQSELFGHVRGAFSGADRARRGLVDQARGGTLLLDEIGDASMALQAALLRLLQERELRPVGADKSQVVDVRFVAATNRDLVEEVRAGTFREDLYARLNRSVIYLPPLRQRREDILPIVAHLMPRRRLSHGLAQALLLHDWPGNVRALQSVVEQLLLREPEHAESASEGESPGAPPGAPQQGAPQQGAPQQGAPQLELPGWLPEVLSRQARLETPSLSLVTQSPVEPEPAVARQDLAKLSAEQLTAHLKTHSGNLAAAAKGLGVGRNTLYRHIERLGIDLDALREELGDGRAR